MCDAGDGEMRLTPTEFRLLYRLASNAGRVTVSTRRVHHAWGFGSGDGTLV